MAYPLAKRKIIRKRDYKMKLFAEKLIKGMTLKEQNDLLENLLFCEALIVAYESYLEHIGKKEDSKEYIHNFLENITNEEMKKALKK